MPDELLDPNSPEFNEGLAAAMAEGLDSLNNPEGTDNDQSDGESSGLTGGENQEGAATGSATDASDDAGATGTPDNKASGTDQEGDAGRGSGTSDETGDNKGQGDQTRGEEQGAGDQSQRTDEEFLADPGLKSETRERFRDILGQRDELRTENEQIKQGAELATNAMRNIHQRLTNAQLQPSDLNGFLGSVADVRSGDPMRVQRGVEYVKQMYQTVMGWAGEVPDNEVPNILDRFPDLKADVTEFRKTESHAIDLAKQRIREEAIRSTGQQNQQREQAANEYRNASNVAVQQIAQWEAGLATDPDYLVLKDRIKQELPQIMQSGMPPSAWPEMIKQRYDGYKSFMQSAGVSTNTNGTTSQPNAMRPGSGSGGGSPASAPATMEDAVANELASMRG